MTLAIRPGTGAPLPPASLAQLTRALGAVCDVLGSRTAWEAAPEVRPAMLDALAAFVAGAIHTHEATPETLRAAGAPTESAAALIAWAETRGFAGLSGELRNTLTLCRWLGAALERARGALGAATWAAIMEGVRHG
jgi:hypothetical protein